MTGFRASSKTHLWRALALAGACIAAQAAQAQDADGGLPASELSAPATSRPATSAETALLIAPAYRAGSECGATSDSSLAGSLDPGCPWANTSISLNIGRRMILPDGEITVRMGFARSNDAALSLDRQLRQSSPARLAENTLMTLGTEARLLDNRLRLTSDFGWSQSWESDIAPSPHWRGRFAQENGFSQRHGFEWTAINRRGLRWKIDGSLSRSSEDYRTGSIQGIGNLLMGQGDMNRLATRIDHGQWTLRASLSDMRTLASRNSLRKVSLEYSGITFAYSTRDGRSLPQRLIAITPAQTSGSSLALELDLFSLSPMLAMQDKGLAVLLPRQLSATLNKREVARPLSALRPLTFRSGVNLSGIWHTPLGDTLIDFDRDRLTDPAGARLEHSSQLLINHSVRIDGWSVSANLLSLRTRAMDGDDDSTLYYSATLARTFANGAKLKFELGRDTQSFGGVASEFTLRDKSHRAKLELDLSAPLQKRLANPSVHLSLGMQVRLNRSRYQLRFLDEIIDADSAGYARQGLLASFGYRF